MTAAARRRPRVQRMGPRKSQHRPEKRTLLIVCEGSQTERNYLDALKREDAVTRRFAITILKGRGGSRQDIVARAVDQKSDLSKDYDEVWCVMDVEAMNTSQSQSDIREAVGIAADNGITLCLSNPAFEVWFLAHFVRTSQQFHDGDAVVTELNKHWKHKFDIKYEKNDAGIYSRIGDLTTSAIKNAKAVREEDHEAAADIADCNSSTEVYRLVKHLLNY